MWLTRINNTKLAHNVCDVHGEVDDKLFCDKLEFWECLLNAFVSDFLSGEIIQIKIYIKIIKDSRTRNRHKMMSTTITASRKLENNSA
jgi:hypothetical protein